MSEGRFKILLSFFMCRGSNPSDPFDIIISKSVCVEFLNLNFQKYQDKKEAAGEPTTSFKQQTYIVGTNLIISEF
jgi:hypothetical protein